MALSVVLLPSPLLPAMAYSGLAEALAGNDVRVSVGRADLAAGESAPDLVRRWVDLVGPDTVLVPHSNAGYLAPSVRAEAGGVQPIVFVDAALSPIGGGATALAPPPFREFLSGLADEDGRLPPWTRWWPRSALEEVIPAADLDALDAACPRLPLRYFDARVTPPTAWADGPAAYLAFGSTYAEELAVAVNRSWPHARLDGGHLHFLHDPDAVAVHVLDLAAALIDRAEQGQAGG